MKHVASRSCVPREAGHHTVLGCLGIIEGVCFSGYPYVIYIPLSLLYKRGRVIVTGILLIVAVRIFFSPIYSRTTARLLAVDLMESVLEYT